MAAAVGRPDAHAGEVAVAYVQLKPGASATEAELMSFAAEHVAERAAPPKKIRIIPAMPLTGVGKIFKPELKNREIEDSLAEALRDAGVEIRSLKVGADPTHGTTVEVSVAAGPTRNSPAKCWDSSHFDFAWSPHEHELRSLFDLAMAFRPFRPNAANGSRIRAVCPQHGSETLRLPSWRRDAGGRGQG